MQRQMNLIPSLDLRMIESITYVWRTLDYSDYSATLEEQQQKTNETKLGNKEKAMTLVDNSSCQLLK